MLISALIIWIIIGLIICLLLSINRYNKIKKNDNIFIITLQDLFIITYIVIAGPLNIIIMYLEHKYKATNVILFKKEIPIKHR